MSYFVNDSYKIDRYKCSIVEANQLLKFHPSVETDAKLFETLLINTNKKWKEDKVRGSWFHVPLSLSVLIPTLVKNGYVYHHAKPELAVLLKWLGDEQNNVPQYPFTNIGVGGIVMDENKRVLVVKEKYNFGVDHWKFPGGSSNQGEEFHETAKREIFEETGIETSFQSLVVIRHHHKYQFGCSDMYVLCYLKPVKEKNPNLELKICSQEITAASWIPAEELLNQLSAFNRYALQKLLLSLDKKVLIGVEKIDSVLKLGKQSVYSINFDS